MTIHVKTPVPVIPSIHQKVYQEALQYLDMSDWQDCRAGIVVRLAGEACRCLAELTHPSTAAIAIYQASDPGMDLREFDFHDCNTNALADMQRYAECEAAAEVAEVEQAQREPELELA